MNYTIKRSNRKTISIEVKPDGILVRAPQRASVARIEQFLKKNEDWIRRQQQRQARELLAAQEEGLLSPEDIEVLSARARDYLPTRVDYYAPLVGVRPGRITIRCQKTRWGSCSAKGNLNFNCLLMLTPVEVIDSVVVHELCHLKEMNHSPRFYAEVRRVYPEYDKWHRWLHDHGGAILKRVVR